MKNFENLQAERNFDMLQFWRRPEPRETRERDRSLRGKARTKARKNANKLKGD